MYEDIATPNDSSTSYIKIPLNMPFAICTRKVDNSTNFPSFSFSFSYSYSSFSFGLNTNVITMNISDVNKYDSACPVPRPTKVPINVNIYTISAGILFAKTAANIDIANGAIPFIPDMVDIIKLSMYNAIFCFVKEFLKNNFSLPFVFYIVTYFLSFYIRIIFFGRIYFP